MASPFSFMPSMHRYGEMINGDRSVLPSSSMPFTAEPYKLPFVTVLVASPEIVPPFALYVTVYCWIDDASYTATYVAAVFAGIVAGV